MARDPLIMTRIPPELEARITQTCQQTGQTRSELLRAALSAHFNTPTPQPQPPPAKPARGRTRSHARREAQCEHRVRTGNYCPRCERLI